FEPVLTKDLHPAEGADDAVFMLFRTVLAFDRVRQQIEITSCVMTEEAAESRVRLREVYDAAVAETERVERLPSEGASPCAAAARFSTPGPSAARAARARPSPKTGRVAKAGRRTRTSGPSTRCSSTPAATTSPASRTTARARWANR